VAIVIVRAPGKVNRRIVGVTFSEGRAEVDTESAAFQFFKRQGYKIKGEAPQVEQADAPLAEVGGAGGAGAQPDSDDAGSGDDAGEPDESGSDDAQEDDGKPERPHPVQGNKAVWFEYLTKIKPDHGFDLEKVQRKELIEAANEVDGITAE